MDWIHVFNCNFKDCAIILKITGLQFNARKTLDAVHAARQSVNTTIYYKSSSSLIIDAVRFNFCSQQ